MRPILILAALWLAAAGACFAQPHLHPLPAQPPGRAWPTQAWPVAPGIGDMAAVNAILERGFAGAIPKLGETRAVVIIQGGALIGERYAQGYNSDTRLVSWSMAKSITQALVGAAVLQGRLAIDQPMGNPRWARSDPRSAITWRHWLQHVDGLRYLEIGAPSPTKSDAAIMLFGASRRDTAAYAASLPLIHPAGTHWNYSTAASLLVAEGLTNVMAPNLAPMARRAAMSAWMKESLFTPIGMTSAQPEFDAQGLYVGGSLVYATARDFAKFGMLYLRDGVWDGRRILPEGWVDFARSPGPDPKADVYGAGFWINPQTGTGKPMTSYLDTGPGRDAFSAQGFEGQMILMVPSKDLVIVRLGLFSDGRPSWDALYEWMGQIARALPVNPTAAAPAAGARRVR